jgi:hypothetical protein
MNLARIVWKLSPGDREHDAHSELASAGGDSAAGRQFTATLSSSSGDTISEHWTEGIFQLSTISGGAIVRALAHMMQAHH